MPTRSHRSGDARSAAIAGSRVAEFRAAKRRQWRDRWGRQPRRTLRVSRRRVRAPDPDLSLPARGWSAAAEPVRSRLPSADRNGRGVAIRLTSFAPMRNDGPHENRPRGRTPCMHRPILLGDRLSLLVGPRLTVSSRPQAARLTLTFVCASRENECRATGAARTAAAAPTHETARAPHR